MGQRDTNKTGYKENEAAEHKEIETRTGDSNGRTDQREIEAETGQRDTKRTGYKEIDGQWSTKR